MMMIKRCYQFFCMFDLRPISKCWRFSVAVTRWSRLTQLLYIEPG